MTHIDRGERMPNRDRTGFDGSLVDCVDQDGLRRPIRRFARPERPFGRRNGRGLGRGRRNRRR